MRGGGFRDTNERKGGGRSVSTLQRRYRVKGKHGGGASESSNLGRQAKADRQAFLSACAVCRRNNVGWLSSLVVEMMLMLCLLCVVCMYFLFPPPCLNDVRQKER